MSILRRPGRSARRTGAWPAEPIGLWTLISDAPYAVVPPSADMNDPGQAWKAAAFTGERVAPQMSPPPWIGVWTYVIDTGDGFEVAVRYTWVIRSSISCTDPKWTYEGSLQGIDCRSYGSYREALGAAYDEAQHIALGTLRVQAEYPEIFDWDGAAFGSGASQ